MHPLPLTILFVFALLWSACSNTSRHELHDPGELTAEQKVVMEEAVRLYAQGEPYEEQLEIIKADPVMSFKFTRVLVLDIDDMRRAREGGSRQWQMRSDRAIASAQGRSRRLSSDPLLRAAAGQRDVVGVRGVVAIDLMGEAAVPCLIEDLVGHRSTYWRFLGVELLARIGPPVLPALQKVAESSSPVERRTAAQVLGALPPSPEGLALLSRLALDPEYGVRAAALTAMAGGGPDEARVLRERLVADDDHFVRRSAAKALVTYAEVETAEAVIAYLERCQREEDADGSEAAQDVLQALAGKRGVRSVAAWQKWLQTYRPDGDG